MKVTIDLPDSASCAILTYIYGQNPMALVMGSRNISTEELRSGEVLTVETIGEEGKK